MKNNRVIDLSFSRKQELVGTPDVNWELLFECAYYPRPGVYLPDIKVKAKSPCSSCSFNKPNPKCKHSHVLIDTRINPPEWQPAITNKKTRVQRKFSLKELLSHLSAEEREDIEKFIAERRTKG